MDWLILINMESMCANLIKIVVFNSRFSALIYKGEIGPGSRSPPPPSLHQAMKASSHSMVNQVVGCN